MPTKSQKTGSRAATPKQMTLNICNVKRYDADQGLLPIADIKSAVVKHYIGQRPKCILQMRDDSRIYANIIGRVPEDGTEISPKVIKGRTVPSGTNPQIEYLWVKVVWD